ncbi:MAG: Si-specific NAD(P)(+) transhydrogenase [Deltaproteobacteria bacterium]|nr:Si-specific NAD(P)(+) transhydrogenase [bacterium]MCB9478979.1 Si-specific NAD(P)(+) transhydrogenase [Deltaproteobacteria bacterium]MCB9487816.1 Si-specific NAD(P)(+) transhydrogenase [Deltaproteobacteria bacterium]
MTKTAGHDESSHFDVVVVGAGPAGQRAAMQASRLGAHVALIERRRLIGGTYLHAGTIPSKILREVAMGIARRRRSLYLAEADPTSDLDLDDLDKRISQVLAREVRLLREQLEAEHITLIHGDARLVGPGELHLTDLDGEGGGEMTVTGRKIILAAGTKPRQVPGIQVDHQAIFDSEFIFSPKRRCKTVPRSLIVLGAGTIGSEYAGTFAAIGCRVTIVEPRREFFPYLDSDISASLRARMSKDGVEFRLQTRFTKVERVDDFLARVTLESGEALEADAVLVALGRTPCVEELGLKDIGMELAPGDVIRVDDQFRTSIPGVYAAGDVIGFPCLASISAEQGRRAASFAMGKEMPTRVNPHPFSIYTIPEVSMIGRTEQELVAEGVKFAKGIAYYRELPKASISGDDFGAVKLLFDPDTGSLLGVHIIGEQASELVHLGQAVMGVGTIDYFIDNVFSYPTLAEAYRIAALNGLRGLRSEAEQDPIDLDSVLPLDLAMS